MNADKNNYMRSDSTKIRLFDLARKGGGWQSLVAVGRALSGLVFAGVTLRLLGFESAGIAWAMLGVTHTVNAVLSLGTITTTTQFLSSSKRSLETLTRAIDDCLGYILVTGVLWIVVLMFVAPYLVSTITDIGVRDPESVTTALIIFGIYGIVFRSFLAITSFLRARQNYRASALSWLFYDLLAVAATAIAVAISPSLIVFSLTLLAVSVFSVVFAGASLRHCYGSLPRPSMSLSSVTRFWKFGRWVYGNEVFASLANGMDRFILSALFSPALLPFYLFPRKLYETIHNVFSNQASFLFTVFSSVENDKDENGLKMQSRVLRLIWMFSLFGAFSYGALLFFADAILTMVSPDPVTDEFLPYIYLFCIIGFFQSFTVPLFHLCYAEKRSAPVFIYSFVNGVGSLILLFAFAKWFGFFEACLSQVIIVMSSIVFAYREIKVRNTFSGFYKFFRAIVVPSILFLFALFFSVQVRSYSSDLGAILLSGLVYLSCFWPLVLWLERLCFGRDGENIVLMRRLTGPFSGDHSVFRLILRVCALT